MTSHPLAQTFGRGAAVACLLLAVGLATTVAVGQSQKPPLSKEEEELSRVGSETTERVCSECHGVEVTRTRRTARDWDDVVTSMAVRGAIATEEELATIKRYLTRRYGLVRINTASAADLVAALGLSTEDANAVVGYRKANGRFANLDELLSVPNIDRARIESQPDALRFN